MSKPKGILTYSTATEIPSGVRRGGLLTADNHLRCRGDDFVASARHRRRFDLPSSAEVRRVTSPTVAGAKTRRNVKGGCYTI